MGSASVTQNLFRAQESVMTRSSNMQVFNRELCVSCIAAVAWLTGQQDPSTLPQHPLQQHALSKHQHRWEQRLHGSARGPWATGSHVNSQV